MMYSANAGRNGQVIIAGTNAMATMMLSLLPPDGTLTGCAGTYITNGWNAGPMLMSPSSPPYGTPVRR
jgi:hypothetical protein